MLEKHLVPESPRLPGYAHVWGNRQLDWFTGWQQAYRLQKAISFLQDIAFNASVTTKTSEPFFCAPFTTLRAFIDLRVASTPTDITIELEYSHNGVDWFKHVEGAWGSLMYEDGAGDKKECLMAPVYADWCRFKATATGTDGTKIFTLSLKAIFSG